MAKILLAEDDEFLRDVLSDCLTELHHVVVAVPNGKAAKDIFLAGKFDLILSDVQMPFLNGVELLQWLRTQSNTPFILMTGFTNLLETQKASELGAQGFLSKPFSNQDLLKVMDGLLTPPVAAPPADTLAIEAEYCKVSIDEFVARPKIEYDIFIRLNAARFLKIAHLGETLDTARLKSYREKGISHLHIKKEDFGKLVDFNIQVSKVLQGNRSVSAEKKMRFMRYTGEVIMEQCYVDQMDKDSFEDARQFFNSSFSSILDQPQLLDLVEILNEHSDHLYAHCLGVALYSLMIAKRMDYTSSQVHFKLAMAGLFHDIGKKEIERQVLDKSRPLLSIGERKMIESHVQRGREIMEFIPSVPGEVVQIIYEHHEDEIEQGYPCNTPHLRLHPLSRIVHMADQFVVRALKSPSNPAASASVALAQIEKFDRERVNTQAFNALKQLVTAKKAA